MAEQKPAHARAQLQLQLYDLRREAKIRQAREWFMQNYFVESIEDGNRIAQPRCRTTETALTDCNWLGSAMATESLSHHARGSRSNPQRILSIAWAVFSFSKRGASSIANHINRLIASTKKGVACGVEKAVLDVAVAGKLALKVLSQPVRGVELT